MECRQMMKLRIKIFFIFLTALTFCNLSNAFARKASSANTQTKYESLKEDASTLHDLSALEFAKDTGGSVAVLEMSKLQTEDIKKFLELYIPCQNEVCDRKTHKCIKGTSTSGSTDFNAKMTTSTTSIKCICVNKDTDAATYDDGAGFWSRKYRYEDAPEGCDGTAFQTFTANAAGGTTIFDYKNVCWTNASDNNRYCIYLNHNYASIQYANEGEDNGSIRGCEVLPVKLYNYRKCFFCPLIGTIYDGVAKVTDLSFQKMAGAFATLLALGFGIWIAIQVLTQVSSLTKQDAPKFLGNLLRQSYKVIIAFLLLQNSTQIFDYAINPIIETGLTFGKNMLTTRNIFSELDKDDNGNYLRQAKFVKGGKHLQLETYDKIEQYVVAVQQHLAFMQTIGTSLTCIGGNLILLKENVKWWHIFRISNNWAQFSVGVQIMTQGLIITIFAFLLSLAFGFYLIDAIVQIGIVGGLMPFMLACWPFKATTKYTSTGVGMLMNSAFLFLFIGLIMSINLTLVNEALSVGHTGKGVMNEEEIDSTKEIGDDVERCSHQEYYIQHREFCDNTDQGTLYKMGMAINSQKADQLKALADISSVGFLILLFCCIFGFKFTSQAKPLADKFAKGALGQPIAPSIATMGTSFAKSAATKLTEPTREAIGRRSDRLIKGVVNAPYNFLSWSYHKIRGRDKKSKATAGHSIGNTPIGANPTAGGGQSGFEQTKNTSKASALNEGKHGSKLGVLNEGKAAATGMAGAKTLNEGGYQDSEDENLANGKEAYDNESGSSVAPETESENIKTLNEQSDITSHGGTGAAAAGESKDSRLNKLKSKYATNGIKAKDYSQYTNKRKSNGGSRHNRKYRQK